MCICIYIYMCIYIYVCMYIYVYIYICMYVYKYVYIYTYVCKYIYIYVYHKIVNYIVLYFKSYYIIWYIVFLLLKLYKTIVHLQSCRFNYHDHQNRFMAVMARYTIAMGWCKTDPESRLVNGMGFSTEKKCPPVLKGICVYRPINHSRSPFLCVLPFGLQAVCKSSRSRPIN